MRPNDDAYVHGYLIASDTSRPGLVQQVLSALHNGWSCVGGVAVNYNPVQETTWWYQAMEKDMREEGKEDE